MYVAQYTDSGFPVVDGVGRVVEAYAYNIAKKGHSCFIAAPRPDKTDRDKLEDINIIGFAGLPIPTTQYKLGIPILDIAFNAKISKEQIDIVHVHSPFSAGTAGHLTARLRKVPLIGTFHSKYYDDFYSVTKSKILSEIGVNIIVDFYNKCDEVWTVSNSTAETLREYGFQKEIIIMENGADEMPFNESSLDFVRKKFNLSMSPTILFVGQMSWKKNQMLILETAAALTELNFDYNLIFVGQGPDSDEIKAKSEELGILKNTLFTGHIPEKEILSALYKLSDILFFPSYYDNAPMVLREAASLNLPSLLIKGSNAAESITDGFNGFLCSDNAKSNAELIIKILNDREKLKIVGDNAKDTIAKPWDKIIDKALERYQSLIDANN
ncbi:MAG: glycosyltransferase family 4 protein [Ruminococcaceae bacterium]|nr:glycosyltransferase family 4 protein [Oscillospiraceae bacterium]